MANRSLKQIEHTIEMGKINRGRIRTIESKEKNKKAHLGKKHTQEWKDKISKNNSRYWLNKKRPEISGEKCHLWKGGISKTRGSDCYNDFEYKLWRKQVFERDLYVCQICRNVGIYLTAHHIKSWKNYPELRFDINNGITLCEDCHKLTDNYKGRIKNNNNL